MTEYTIWRHKRGLLMHGDRLKWGLHRREVRYAVPHEISEDLRSTKPDPRYEVPIRCVRNVQSDRGPEDRPQAQWAKGPPMPVTKFLELYEPVS